MDGPDMLKHNLRRQERSVEVGLSLCEVSGSLIFIARCLICILFNLAAQGGRHAPMSVGEGSSTDFLTARGRDYPTIRQFTVFLENRVGQLLEVVRRFEGSKVRIVALSINDATECAFVRFLLSHPEQGREILERAGLPMIETDLIGIELPEGSQPLLDICTALLQAEVNIIQAYPIMVRPHGLPAVAVMVDNTDMALDTLASKGLTMITERDLQDFE
jgi:hypothetical protein